MPVYGVVGGTAFITAIGIIDLKLIGKIKTASQMLAIPLLLYHDPLGGFDPQSVGTWLIYLAAILTLLSMAYYLKAALPQARRGT